MLNSLNQAGVNIKLSDEELKQLDFYESRLSSLRNEITISTQNLKYINDDNIKALKTKEFLDFEIQKLTSVKSDLELQISSLRSSIQEALETLEKNKKKSNEILSEITEERTKLNDEKDKLLYRENKLEENEREFKSKWAELVEDKLQVKKVVDGFVDVKKLIKWS